MDDGISQHGNIRIEIEGMESQSDRIRYQADFQHHHLIIHLGSKFCRLWKRHQKDREGERGS